jgi:predicted site-specific integrase-resolvase
MIDYRETLHATGCVHDIADSTTELQTWDRQGRIRWLEMQNNFRRISESEINRLLGVRNG